MYKYISLKRKILSSFIATSMILLPISPIAHMNVDATYLAPAKNTQLKDILNQLIESGVIPSNTVKLYNAIPNVTKYEQDLIIFNALYSAHLVNEKLNDNQILQLKNAATIPEIQKAVINVYGNKELIDAILAIKDKKTSSSVQSKTPPTLPNSNFSRTFSPPVISKQAPPQQSQQQMSPPPEEKIDPVPNINPLSDVGILEASTLKTKKEIEKEALLDKETKKNKATSSLFNFWIEHKLNYKYTKTEGATIYDTENNLDAYGNPTEVKYKDEYKLSQDLILKMLLNASNDTKITCGIRAYNPDGIIGKSNTSYSFDNIIANMKKVHTLTIGRFSESFGKYNVNLDNIKGVEYSHKGKKGSLTLLAGKTGQYNDSTYSDGTPQKIFGFQYAADKLIENVKLAFAYATGTQIADSNVKQKIASLVFSGENKNNQLSFGGEINIGHAITKDTNENLLTPSYIDSSIRAIYLDIAKSFGKLSTTFHFVDISPNYSGFVKDNEGYGTYTSPDGLSDFPYPAGQKGYDISLGYKVNNSLGIQAGYSNYSHDENNNTNIVKKFLSATYIHRTFNKTEQTSQTDINLRYEGNGENGIYGSKISGEINSSIMLAKNTSLALGFMFANGDDGQSSDERRYIAQIQKKWDLAERVSLTASASYEKKIRKESNLTLTDYSAKIDSSKKEGSIGLTYELIPGILNTSIVYTRTKSDISNPEYSMQTGQNLDGESEDRSSVMLGFDWHYNAIPGLTLTAGVGKDTVHYYDTGIDSKQNVVSAGLEYKRDINDTTAAGISYEYTARKDPSHPEHNETLNSIDANVDVKLNEDQRISIKHTKESTTKNYDPDSNSKVTQTTIEMVNKF